MITESNIEQLDKLVAKYALQDYQNTRKKLLRNGKCTTCKGYSLSPQTEEAREMLHLARKENITQEEEEIVKAYLLKQKLLGEED